MKSTREWVNEALDDGWSGALIERIQADAWNAALDQTGSVCKRADHVERFEEMKRKASAGTSETTDARASEPAEAPSFASLHAALRHTNDRLHKLSCDVDALRTHTIPVVMEDSVRLYRQERERSVEEITALPCPHCGAPADRMIGVYRCSSIRDNESTIETCSPHWRSIEAWNRRTTHMAGKE